MTPDQGSGDGQVVTPEHGLCVKQVVTPTHERNFRHVSSKALIFVFVFINFSFAPFVIVSFRFAVSDPTIRLTFCCGDAAATASSFAAEDAASTSLVNSKWSFLLSVSLFRRKECSFSFARARGSWTLESPAKYLFEMSLASDDSNEVAFWAEDEWEEEEEENRDEEEEDGTFVVGTSL